MRALLRYLHIALWKTSDKAGGIWLLTCLGAFCKALYLSLKYRGRWSLCQRFTQYFFQQRTRNPAYFIPVFKKTLRVAITYRCDAACPHCYARKLKGSYPDMSLYDFTSLLGWAKKNGWTAFRFLGGEPTKHPFFKRFVALCAQEKIRISISTNNLFPPDTIDTLDSPWLHDVTINYSVRDSLSRNQEAVFLDNLNSLKERRVPFSFSCIVHARTDYIDRFKEDINRFRPRYVRASIAIPPYLSEENNGSLRGNAKYISHTIIVFQKTCIRSGIPFFMYRPIPSCIFNANQWHTLCEVFPLTVFTRCPLGYGNDYSIMTTVNPDLTIYPCASLFIGGVHLNRFADRNEISNFFENRIKDMLSSPVSNECDGCERFHAFLETLKSSSAQSMRDYFSDTVCQAGCGNFHQDKSCSCSPE